MEKSKQSICLVSPFPPPYGGMAIQAEKLMSLLKKNGFKVIAVITNADLPGVLRFLDRIKGLGTLLRTSLFLKNLFKSLHKVEVVYFLTGFFNFFFWVTYPALIMIKLRRKRIVLNARGGGAKEFFERYGLLVKPILKRVDAIAVPSGFLMDVFRETLNIETRVVPNIADLGQFRFRERFPVRPRLLVTRNLEKIYNVPCIIKAFNRIHDCFPESRLGIAGDGGERAGLAQMVTKLKLNDSITFYGTVEHAKIQDIYDQYDIYVNASNVDNFPGTILEAFACGLPVVSTNPGGIPYMVSNGVTGMLVDVGDCESLAEKVIYLVEHPEFALQLAQNAREECHKYSWDTVKTLLLPLLENTAQEMTNPDSQ